MPELRLRVIKYQSKLQPAQVPRELCTIVIVVDDAPLLCCFVRATVVRSEWGVK